MKAAVFRLITLFVFLSFANTNAATGFAADDAFEYLNEIRTQAGMQLFKRDRNLALAAQMHADYLLMNNAWGHEQRPGNPGFTGQTPLDRMLRAGYSSRHNSENVSTHKGAGDALKSIDGLMGAIYHRFSFLTFDFDEVGVGHASQGDYHSFVYNLGNTIKAGLCDEAAKDLPPGHYIFKVCADEQQRINQETFNRALTSVQAQNPAYVALPADGLSGISPAFYIEAPDPLPGVDVSGYPVSIQFNPVVFEQPPKLERFELFQANAPETIESETVKRERVELLARFDKQTDIHGKFTAYEHAIFPRYRLDWNTVYRAEVDYLDSQGEKQSINWEFRTQAFDQPFYEISGMEEIHAVNDELVVYSPPLSANDARSEYQVSFIGFRDISVRILDAHTLLISPKGMRGRAEFDFHGKRFSVYR